MEKMSNNLCDELLKEPAFSSIFYTLPEKHREHLCRLFACAPLELIKVLRIRNVEVGTAFIVEKTPVDKVYILIKGFIRASEYRVFDKMYGFSRFCPVEMFGSMEVLLEIQYYRATLIAETPCVLLQMSRDSFERWIQSDVNALMIEAKRIGSYLLEQAAKERVGLFLRGKEKLMLLLLDKYEQKCDNKGYCVLRISRQDLSILTGLSERTISRALNSLQDEEYLSLERKKIILQREQYIRMKNHIHQIVPE